MASVDNREQERQLRVLAGGAQAKLAMATVGEKLAMAEELAKVQLLTVFKMGEPPEKMLGPVASLAAIADLKGMLMGDIRRADAVERKQQEQADA